MVTHVNLALRRLQEAGLLQYHQTLAVDTFVQLLYKELREAGEYVSSTPKISWAPVRMVDTTISRPLYFLYFFHLCALMMLFVELYVGHINGKIRAYCANNNGYAAHRRVNRWRIFIKKKAKKHSNLSNRIIQKKIRLVVRSRLWLKRRKHEMIIRNRQNPQAWS